MSIFPKPHPPAISKAADWVFALLTAAALVPVWMGDYFLTGDGPVHLYNARILLDMFQGLESDFYQNYLELNLLPFPNWTSQILLTVLMGIFSASLAQKLLLSAYVILLPLSLRTALVSFHKDSNLLALLGFPFIYTYAFQAGFYNYCFSFILLFFFLSKLPRGIKMSKEKQIAKSGFLFLFLYATHVLTLGISWIVLAFWGFGQKLSSGRWPAWINGMALASLPAIGLLVWFAQVQGAQSIPNHESIMILAKRAIQLSSLILLTDKEAFFAYGLTLLLSILTISVLWRKIRDRDVQVADSLLLVAVVLKLAYLLAPEGISGGGILNLRLQPVPHMVLLVWLGTNVFSRPLRLLILCLAPGLFLGSLILRIPVYQECQRGINEIMSAGASIQEGSTVLPLSFVHNGHDALGQPISSRIWLFHHFADFLGAEKSLILFDNYQANTGYFPLLWKPERNPFYQIATNEGMENDPPSVDFLDYANRTGGEVDYVMTWCMPENLETHSYLRSISRQLKLGYQEIPVARSSRVKVFKKIK